MSIDFVLRGIAIGFAIAAPVGPIGILVIRRTLADGPTVGFVSGLGAATADAVYGSIAAFGLTFISSILISESDWIRLVGGAVLCYLALTILVAKPAEEAAAAGGRGLLGAYGTTAFLTLTNPTTIISFVAVFAALGAVGTHAHYGSSALLVAGVFMGSAFWWLVLSSGIGCFRSRFTPRGLRWVNRVSGVVLVLFGLGSLASVLRR
jgi:threonine/homoserine/homoserine lactone efflux protein